MALPKISIVTTSYNQGQYLAQCIESVLDQKYPNLEYLVVDGGSKDNSVEVIKKYEKHITWWVSEKDRGQPDALNKGFNRATGDVHGFINSDDWLEPGALDAVGKSFSQGAQWVVGWVRFFDPEGGEYPQVWQSYESPQDWFVTNPLPQQGTFWAGPLWKQFGGFREDLDLVFDYEFWLRLRFKGKVVPQVMKRCLAAYRLHPASKTCSRADSYHAENESVRAEYMKLLTPEELRNVTRHRRRWLAQRSNKLGWRALAESDVKQARDLAVEAMKQQPLSIDAWRFLYCALRGR